MPNTIIIRQAFASRDDAEGARERLQYGGFPREDIAIVGFGEQYELAIHTRPEHAQRVSDCINSSSLTVQASRYAHLIREHAPSAGHSLILLAVIAGTVGALAYALRRNHQQWLHDTGNIDRRWDRPDRLADTRHEDEDWKESTLGFGSPGLNRHSAAYGA